MLEDPEEELDGLWLGSCQKLHGELIAIAPKLGITLSNGILTDEEAEKVNRSFDDREEAHGTEKIVWIALFENARLSIEHRTILTFC